ncbi:Na+/H+ antiporter subunit G [Paracoccus suum]|uniref:Na+/H+ antiporter subunit G n=1 Tax=Paracoccus suum TaxID=2259340 RepID=A0A344PPF1_9RHOB|nr:Na+/H+ antiporter subunit G [Paracoccus suum]
MAGLTDLLIAALLVIGGIFGLVGSWGLIRLPSTMTRLHAPTKATTLGVGGVLIASMIYFGRMGDAWGHELLITLFLLLTAPISCQFIAKSVIHRATPRSELPPTATGADWATVALGTDTGAGAGEWSAAAGEVDDRKAVDAPRA